MSASSNTRRAAAEIDSGDGANDAFKAGNRPIHQFWHLFSPHFRHVLLAPQRRAGSGRVAWTWSEALEKRPVTATELAEVRRRLSEAIRSYSAGSGGLEKDDDSPSDGSLSLEHQVRSAMGELVAALVEHRDAVLAAFVCRTDAGLMVHSWGAATAGEPHYPDAQQNEISGTLFVGSKPVVGGNVVLADTEGLAVAQTKSDHEGGFRFPGVAPGNYRISVVGRGEFPSDGFPVTMQRESITGLEFRGKGQDDPIVADPPPVSTEAVAPWYRRKAALLLALPLIVGAGGVWYYVQRPSEKTPPVKTADSSWQSATGRLAIERTKQSTGDAHKAGADGAWSTLSASREITKPLTSRNARGESDANRTERVPLEPDDSGISDIADAEGKPAPDFSGKTPMVSGETPASTKPRKRQGSASPSKEPHSDTNPDAPVGAERESDESRGTQNEPAKMPSAKPASKTPASREAGRPSTGEIPAAASASGSDGAPADPAASSVSSGGGGSSGKSSGSKAAAANGAGASASDATPEAEADEQNPGSPHAAAGTKSNQVKSGSAQNANNGNNGLSAQRSGASPSDSAAKSEPVDEAPDDSAGSGGASNNAAARAKSTKNPSTHSSPSASAQSANQAGDAQPPAPGSKTPKKAAKASASVGEGKTNAPAPGDDRASLSNDSGSAATPLDTTAGDNASAANKKKGSKRKSSMSAASEPEGQPEDSALRSSIAAGKISNALSPDSDAGPLVQVGRIRATAWKARLLQDAIIPTRPMTAEEEGAVESMREKILQQRALQMPPAFRQPHVRTGFAVAIRDGSSHWRDDAGGEPPGVSVRGVHAELGWSDGAPPRNANYTLLDGKERELARISFDQAGVPQLKMVSGVKASYWAVVEQSPADRFEWRLLKKRAVPALWSREDHGARVDIPLDAGTARRGSYEIALVDPATGWALVGNIGFEMARGVPSPDL